MFEEDLGPAPYNTPPIIGWGSSQLGINKGFIMMINFFEQLSQ